MDEFAREQRRRNQQSRNAWDAYSTHRERIRTLIHKAAQRKSSSLTILGAGNCNDLNLAELVQQFAEVTLVDIDGESVRSGVEAQQVFSNVPIEVVESDLSGISKTLLALDSADAGAIRDAATQAMQARVAAELSRADVVASTGLLSQIIESGIAAIGESTLRVPDSPAFQLIQAMRRRHMRLLAEQTEPGGTVILVTEIVSSDTAPEICDTTPEDLPAVLARCLAAGDFFTGLHPGILMKEFQSGEVSRFFDSVEASSPWLWNYPARTYAVVAFVARRSKELID